MKTRRKRECKRDRGKIVKKREWREIIEETYQVRAEAVALPANFRVPLTMFMSLSPFFLFLINITFFSLTK
jgi:hypothetical protein